MSPHLPDHDQRALLERLRHVDAAALQDAQRTLRLLPQAIRPVSAATAVLGRAVTVDSHDDLVGVLAGLEAAGPGDVLVVTSNGSPHAVAGELFATEAARRGLAGIVIDGFCRDSDALRTMALPVFARGVTPRASRAILPPVVNVPVMFDEVVIDPGDLVVGDGDGIVVATPDELEEALERAEGIKRVEDSLLAAMADGTSLLDKVNLHEHIAALGAGEPSSLRFL